MAGNQPSIRAHGETISYSESVGTLNRAADPLRKLRNNFRLITLQIVEISL